MSEDKLSHCKLCEKLDRVNNVKSALAGARDAIKFIAANPVFREDTWPAMCIDNDIRLIMSRLKNMDGFFDSILADIHNIEIA